MTQQKKDYVKQLSAMAALCVIVGQLLGFASKYLLDRDTEALVRANAFEAHQYITTIAPREWAAVYRRIDSAATATAMADSTRRKELADRIETVYAILTENKKRYVQRSTN